MLINNKVKSYVGFAIRSKNVIFGGDNIPNSKKHIYLVICSEGINRTTQKTIAQFVFDKKVSILYCTNQQLEELTHKYNCKCIAICDFNLAKAIIDQQENGGLDE